MPRVGPGDDNVTGDRMTMDLGVSPDLGNLLSNLTVANQLLDAAEAKFQSIGDIVSSTTQRISQMTRQTELAVAQAQRLGNSWQGMATASMTMANVGMGAMGGMMPGMNMNMMPGQMAFGGMPPAMMMPMQGNTIQTMPSSVENPGEDIPEFGPSRETPTPRIPGMSALKYEQTIELARRFKVSRGGGFSNAISKLKAGWNNGSMRGASQLPMASPNAGAASGATNSIQDMFDAAKASPGGLSGMDLGAAASSLGEGAGALALGGETAGALGALGGAAADFAGPVAAGLFIAKKAYNTWADAQASSRRLAGITGGPAGIGGVFGGPTGGSLYTGARAGLMGLLNPGVDYGEIQNRAAGAGYVSGQGYEQARDYLFETYKRGIGTTIDQMDLYMEAVDKAGGSTSTLVDAMDRMRSVAASSNANLTAMATNYKKNIETFVAMGMGGNTASQAALIQSTGFAGNSLAQMSPVLRNANGWDITNTLNQATITSQLGVPFNALGITAATTPGLGTTLPALTEQAVVDRLKTLGFTANMTYTQIADVFKKRGWNDNAGQILKSLGLLPSDVDVADLNSVINSVMLAFRKPVTTATQEQLASAQPKQLGMVERKTEGGSAMNPKLDTIAEHIQAAIGQDVAGHGGADMSGAHFSSYSDVSSNYTKWSNANGGKYSPIIDKLLQGGSGAVINTYVRYKGQMMNLAKFSDTHPDWIQLLSDPTSGVQIATATAEQQKTLGTARGAQYNQDLSSILGHAGTGSDLVTPKEPTFSDAQTKEGRETRLSPWTIDQLRSAFKDAVAEI